MTGEFNYRHPLRVRWTEVDMQGIVYFGHYITYCDMAMTEYFRYLGLPYPEGLEEAGVDFFVKKTLCEYHGSARFDDELEVGVRVARLGNSSITWAFAIDCGEERLADAEMIYVCADPRTRRSAPIPDRLRDILTT